MKSFVFTTINLYSGGWKGICCREMRCNEIHSSLSFWGRIQYCWNRHLPAPNKVEEARYERLLEESSIPTMMLSSQICYLKRSPQHRTQLYFIIAPVPSSEITYYSHIPLYRRDRNSVLQTLFYSRYARGNKHQTPSSSTTSSTSHVQYVQSCCTY